MSPPTPASDVELIERIARGENAALDELYGRYAGLMLGLAVKLMRDRREAEDLLHDVVLEVWRKAASYDARRASVRSWLLMRLRSRALDRLRSARLSRGQSLEETPLKEPVEARPGPDSAPDRTRLRAALATLPDAHREVLVLAYFRGLSAREIAEQVGIPVGTVKSRLRLGLGRLRGQLAEAS